MFPPDEHLRSDPAAEINAAHVYVGLGEQFDFATSAVRPIRVFPGTHLLSIVDHVLRQRLKSQALATLGYEVSDIVQRVKQREGSLKVSQSYQHSVIFEPVYTIPSPFAHSSDPNIATLTITIERFTKREWVVNQDFRNKSVLIGLSEVGGLSSFLSTLLVMLLGTSLMKAMLRE